MNFPTQTHNQDQDREINALIRSAANDVENNAIAKIVNHIIRDAFKKQASDIHIEPVRDETIVRLRIDGMLKTTFRLPKNTHKPLIARLKIMANLKIDEHRRPQDGRIVSEETGESSLRISIMPTLFGEKAALRTLNDTTKDLYLEELGFSKTEADIIKEHISKPHGLIINSGPTGSGKTTTLYAILQKMKGDGVNISTLEDPIEYTLKDVNQIQINPNADLTFASGLRALLRQDPDIMMVGEIRDSETALMCADAAMTGHLVLTTLHTNDAPSVFTRLLEMGVEDYITTSSINLVMAQRLVRKVCESCAETTSISPQVLEKIKKRKDVERAFEKTRPGLLKNVHKYGQRAGKGCEECMHTGYRGRVGIFEIVESSKTINNHILGRSSSQEIRRAVEKEGYRDIVTSGIEKVFAGTTTLEEVLRVTKNY